MTITMDTLTGMGEGEKVVTTGAAGQRVWTADGDGNLIDVAGAPVPVNYFASHVAASTIVAYREGMEDNPQPDPGSLVQRGNAYFIVLGPKPEDPGFVQLGYMDGSTITRLYEYNWEVESPNINLVSRTPEEWGGYAGYMTARGTGVYGPVRRGLARGNTRPDVKARLREFADEFGNDDFWQFLRAYDLVPTVQRTVTVNLEGRASVDPTAFGEGFEAGGTATWKRQVTATITALPEAGCVCDQINPQDFVDEHKPASATTARVESTNCGEGCTHN